MLGKLTPMIRSSFVAGFTQITVEPMKLMVLVNRHLTGGIVMSRCTPLQPFTRNAMRTSELNNVTYILLNDLIRVIN